MRTLLAIVAALAAGAPVEAAPTRVVTTLPTYASIAALIGGDRVETKSIARGDEDAHFIKPKPSYALMLKEADLFVTTGLDLELWAPVLIDKSGNRAIRPGGPGYVSASEGVHLLEVPENVDRSAGDVHVYGNPHVFTSPIEARAIARNIAEGLARIDPAGEPEYREGLAVFLRRIDEALYGRELVELLDADTLHALTRAGRLIPFLAAESRNGRPLIERLGGWLGRMLPFRDRKIVAYHKNWIYLTELFGLEVVGYVEPKPGIPPSARHVHALVGRIREQGVEVLLAASYFGRHKIDLIAERTGSRTVIVPLGPGGGGPSDYFTLIDHWVDELARAFAG